LNVGWRHGEVKRDDRDACGHSSGLPEWLVPSRERCVKKYNAGTAFYLAQIELGDIFSPYAT
jgi:hypothetical protein